MKFPRFKLFGPKQPDWLDSYLETEYGNDVPDVEDDEVLTSVPDHLTEEDVDRHILQHAIQTTAIPTRQRVRQTTRTTASENQTAPGLAYFKSLLERDSDLAYVSTSLGMVIELLRDSYKNQKPGESFIENIGFDRANLHALLKGLFSAIKGEVIPQKRLVAFLTKFSVPGESILYYYLLGLKDDSPEAEIDARCQIFKQQADRLDQLLEYPTENVNRLILTRDDPNNVSYSTAQLAEALGFSPDVAVRFDADVAKQMLAEAGENQKNTYYSAFCEANSDMPALAMLDNMATAFSAHDAEYAAQYQGTYFNGQSVAEVVGNLDRMFPEVPGFGRELLSAGMKGGNAQALVRRINESCKLTSPQELHAKLTAIYQAIRHQYRGLDPLREEPKETAEQPEIDFTTYWQEIKSDLETSRVYHQLHQLHFALRRTEEQYEAKNRRQHFEDLDRKTVLAALNSTLGADLVAAMKMAADLGKGVPYQFYALIEVIAKHSDATRDPDKLKRRLCEVSDTLHGMFPDLSA